jgi:class 3 adenylate cyclase
MILDRTTGGGRDAPISATMRERLPPALALVALPTVKVKGRSANVELYRLG